MGQPIITHQPTETPDLVGAGAHSSPCGIALPADENGNVILSGCIAVLLVVHDANAPKAVRLVRADFVTVSAGVIVATTPMFEFYRHVDWSGIAAPIYVIENGDLVVVFDAPNSANVDASSYAWMMET